MVLFPPFSVLTSNVRDELVANELDDGELSTFAPRISDRDALTTEATSTGETDSGEMG
jgi:hypothetical protein